MSEWQETEIGTIPSDWKLYTVEQLVESKIIDKPIDGNHGEIHPKGSDFVETGIPFVMATDINNGNVDLVNCKFITKEQADSLNKGFSISDDVLLTHKASLGRTAIVDQIQTPYIMLTPQVTYYRVKNKNLLSNKYLKYFFDSPAFQDTLANHGDSGSTRAYVGITAQRELPIILPSNIAEQKAIASVLSSLDDKIDLLHRQNKTLEAMAETLFRQWFVEEAQEDWKAGTLGDVVNFNYGKTLKDQERSGSGYPVVGSSGVVGFHKNFLVEAPGIVTGRKGTLGVVNYFFDNFFPIDTTFYITSKIQSDGMFYEYFLVKSVGLGDMNSDSAVPGLNRNAAHAIPVTIPPSELVRSFNNFCKPTFAKINTNIRQIQTLEKLRDTLLPKLMSGEIRINYA
ncbi:restriction endonuclease subunit S [Nitrosomonas sp.]|uniref:restriction endonuclease subunit S n=1 Tax=Nitrosomonas sp. TaxID=42353 RepID=UPI002721721C|nr:restriction endonuclease subunit S [Nitrosomonas sp.]MDO8895376.1 restriction endonuclease subunit S [Nitrosomonas sp.]